MKTLRTDQAEAIGNVREALKDAAWSRKNKQSETSGRIIVSGPCGVGKTVIIADIVSRARDRDKKILITVPAISLVDQTVIALNAQGVEEIGVIQAAHHMTDWSRPVQVCSVQTLMRRWRDKQMPKADLVLVDEVHRMFTMFSQWIPDPEWTEVPFVGFSATPWSRGLGRLYNSMIPANNIKNLIEQKVLVPFRTFAPDMPDLSGVRESDSDFVEADLEEVMRPKKLVANIVATWKELASERPTVGFCCSRAHADQLAKEFTDAGIGAGYVDCDTPLSERNEVRRRMLAGDIRIVFNVDVIGLGVDWPEISCIIYARPTMSDMRFVQNIGRGLRASPKKEDLLILDHSTTTARLGFVDEIYAYHPKLDDGKIKPKREIVLLPKMCPACHLMKPPRCGTCPHCGHKVEAHIDPVPVERGTLREIKPGDDMKYLRKLLPDKVAVMGQLVWYGRRKGYNEWWPNMKFKEIYGVRFPKFDYMDKISQPCPELYAWIVDSTKKWAGKHNYTKRKARNGNSHMNGNSHDHGALTDREQAIIDRVAEQAKASLMSDQEWDDMGDFR